MGSNWLASMGSNWFGSNWNTAGPGQPTFAMRADKPLAAIKIDPDLNAKFRERDWDPDLLALTILPQFLAVEIGGKSWHEDIVLPAPHAINEDTIKELLILAVTERPEALGEIVQEHQNFQLRWLQLLNIDGASHPATFLLMKLAARVGELAMMSLKRLFPEHPRPAQVCPTLYPPVPVPGHSSYPSGHAVIGYLTSACLAQLVPAREEVLYLLAERVSFNRVIAGLHYPQDSEEGAKAGIRLHAFIKECELYQDTFDVAQNEWS